MKEFEQIDLSFIEKSLKEIDWLFHKLNKSVDIKTQSELEFCIYYFACTSSDISRIYTRNLYRLNKETDIRFLAERKNYNSDLATTKKIKKDLIKEYTEIELQEMVIDWLNDRKKDIRRLADHIDWIRIDWLAQAKRMLK